MVGLHLSLVIVCYLCTIKQFNSTIFSDEAFDVQQDIKEINKAIRSTWGIDKDTIINIISHRSLSQRFIIKYNYKNNYNKDLDIILRRKLSGNHVKSIVSAMMRTIDTVLAIDLHDTIFSIRMEKENITEIMGTLINTGMQMTVDTYKKIYENDLKDDLEKKTSGTFKYLCVSLCTIVRDELNEYTLVAMESIIKILYNNGEKRSKSGKLKFIDILVKNDYKLLRHVFLEYKQFTSEEIENTIEKEFHGGTRLGLLSLVKSIRNRDVYFAERLHDAMDRLRINHKTIIRIIVTRSELDIFKIKQAFKNIYNDSLESWIGKNTSGLYQTILLNMVATVKTIE